MTVFSYVWHLFTYPDLVFGPLVVPGRRHRQHPAEEDS